ncbi:hypothetical protein KPH14_004528 [Odynerus spinipes]|uniref:Proton-coupled folate transporter n=1 Tax=Odynerus spinipes TaxID=1348599 RepID=A0AAD9RN29_9HYME|nr:hypothetical protein KPH14_004528 [Odynerus spinipes]
MASVTTTTTAPAPAPAGNPEKKAEAVKTEEAVPWKSMTVREKLSFLASNITVEPMIACYVIPSMLASLATQNLNLEKACRVNLGYSDDVCTNLAARNTSGLEREETAVQQLVAGMQTWKTALQSGLPILLILFMGAWSDKTGLRKPCMLLPIVGEFLSSVSMIACTYWFYELPMEATGVLEALWPSMAGGWFTMFMGVFSYIADITSVESRTLRIGAANVFFSLGVPIGMALSGVLYMKLGFYGVFTISMVCYILSFVYGLVVIKEPPRPPPTRTKEKLPEKKMSLLASAMDFFSLKHIEETFGVAFKKGSNNRQKRVIILMIIVMVVIGPLYGEMAVLYLYMRYRYNWNEVKFSMWSTYGMVTNLIGTVVSVGVFSHILKIDDALVGIMSCMSKILASFVYAFATTDWMIYLGALVEIVNGTSFIAMRSIASKLVPSDELGKVNSLFGVCESLMPLFYGPMYSSIYAATMNTFPGAFFIAGGCMTIPAVFGFFWLYTEHRKDRALLEIETKMKANQEDQDGKSMKVQTISEKKEICAVNDARRSKLKGMVPKWTWIAVNLFICTIASLENDNAKAFLELTELGYEDACNDTATAEWLFLNSLSNRTAYTIWEEHQIQYGKYKKSQKEDISNISNISLSDPSLVYKYNVIEKPGDALLDEEEFKQLVHFTSSAEFLRSSAVYTKEASNHSREDVERLLSHNGHAEDKRVAWTSWYRELNPLVGNFSYVLGLAEKAAKANGANSVTEYWEILSGYPSGYEKIKYHWQRISSLHKNILKFAQSHLAHKYGINLTETVPPHLLGSLQGYEWNTFSIDKSPYSEITYTIRKNLWKKKLFGKSLYKVASNMGNMLLSEVLQSDFWDKSQFHRHCPPKLVNFCKYGITRVSTCFEPTIANFLLTHQNVAKILFQQMSAESTPILNIANRYSGLEEGLSELFGILSASPAWLSRNGLMYDINDTDHKIVSLMITALDVLPRLAYYMSADMWRINAIENNITDPAELIKSWWKYRLEYEGISKPDPMDVPTFLNDEYITSNKPYLSKFVGVFLGFQIYEYIMESTEVRYDINKKVVNSKLIKLVQHGAADNWMGVITKFLEIDDIIEYSLITFFTPLEDFIAEMEEDEFDYKFEPTNDAELEEVERAIIQEINAPTTTPTTTTTTTQKIKLTTTLPTKSEDDKSHGTSKSDKKAESDLSSNIQADKPKSDTDSQTKQVTPNPYDELFKFDDLKNEEDEKKPKINSSKAVWAVAAVLVATIIICVIAIFGRQRCRKTPKNRRYV